MNGGIGMMDRVTDSIRPKRLMVLVQSNGIIRREPDHYLIGRLAEDVSFSNLDAEGRNSNQCAASRPSCPEIPDKSMPICPIQPADDPRKAMLDEIRTRIYQGFDSCEHHFVHEAMEFILDEMEAKL